MSFSENLIGRLFSWGGVNFLIVEVEGDSVIAVCRTEHNHLERVRVPVSKALQTLDAIEVNMCDAPEPDPPLPHSYLVEPH